MKQGLGRSLIESVMGAVVLAIAAFFLMFAYTSADLRPVQGYALKAEFNSVGSLTTGNDVRIGGVKVGSVTAQSINSESYRAIVTFTIQPDLKLPEDTVASVASDGLLGGKYLRLEVGRSKKMLAAGATLRNTRDALSLEELLGKAIFLLTDDPGSAGKKN
jgi:phospholipid/cholesterol/gamma-HCH transport system substrate-binding protein